MGLDQVAVQMSFLSPGVLVVVLLSGSFSQSLLAQATLEARLATEVQSAVTSVSIRPTLSAWKASHGRERTDFAHYETDKDSYEVDFTNQWCVTSVAEVLEGITRAASFYVPEVTRGALPLLPAKQGSTLTASCRLGAVWYEARGYDAAAGVVRQLTVAWGAPSQPTRSELARSLRLGGSGLWKDVSTWRRGIVTVWMGRTDWDKGNGAVPRTIVWIVRDRGPDFDLFTAGFDTTAAAVKIASLSPALTADLKPGTNCAAVGAEIAVGRLSRWLKASDSLQAERRAAALLVADSFVRCVQASGAKPSSLAALGVKFGEGCPQDGPDYAGNLREQAEALDPTGPAGALAALASLQTPCSLKGSGSWPERVLDRGQKFLRQFAPGPWSPWVHFAMARAHEVKLSFSLPPGEADIGVIHHLSALQARQERTAAITEFAQFITEQPNSPDAVFAWQEAWRLMAGLSPSPPHFGCGCE
jgi:hypothetical protein